MKTNYLNQLKSGDWQKKRLEIFQRDDFKCRVCGANNELAVHHLYYLPNTKIWEYDNDGMVTVCKKCHDILTHELGKLAGILAFEILCNKYNPLSN